MKRANSNNSNLEIVDESEIIDDLIYSINEYKYLKKFIDLATNDNKNWRTIACTEKNVKLQYIDEQTADGLCIARGSCIINCSPEYLFKGFEDWQRAKELDTYVRELELKHVYDSNRRIVSGSFSAGPLWYREIVYKELRALIDDKRNILVHEINSNRKKNASNSNSTNSEKTNDYSSNSVCTASEEEKANSDFADMELDCAQYKNGNPSVDDIPIVFMSDFMDIEKRAVIAVARSVNSKDCPFEDIPRLKHVRGQLEFGGYYFEDIGNHKSKATYVVKLHLKGWVPTWLMNVLLRDQAKNIITMREYVNKQLLVKEKKLKN